MTDSQPTHLLRWVIIAWTLWIIILACSTFWYANGKAPFRTLLFIAVTLPILAVWLIAWKKSSGKQGR